MKKKTNDRRHVERSAKVSPGKHKNVGVKKTDSGAKRPDPPSSTTSSD